MSIKYGFVHRIHFPGGKLMAIKADRPSLLSLKP